MIADRDVLIDLLKTKRMYRSPNGKRYAICGETIRKALAEEIIREGALVVVNRTNRGGAMLATEEVALNDFNYWFRQQLQNGAREAREGE